MAQCKRDGCTNEGEERTEGYCSVSCYFGTQDADDSKGKDGGKGGAGGVSPSF